MKRYFLITGMTVSMFIIVILLLRVTTSQLIASQPFLYASPHAGAQYVQSGTTIAIRYATEVDPATFTDKFEVIGTNSGLSEGAVQLADDRRTILFVPDQPFAHGEQVHVYVRDGIKTVDGTTLSGGTFQFSVAADTVDVKLSLFEQVNAYSITTQSSPAYATGETLGITSDLKTVPSDFPPISVGVKTTDTGEGSIFLANFTVDWVRRRFDLSKSYLLILDNDGEPVYYQRMQPGVAQFDFKKLPNGNLSYYEDGGLGFSILNEQYELIDVFSAGNGYARTDNHDFQILSNGHAIVMIYDWQSVDMSTIVPGGNPDATVIGLVLQELDTSKNVVFEWRSWDHIPITDSYADLTAEVIDYVHGNSVEVDSDGNWLVSNLALGEVTKIDRETGDIIWRMGGKQNMFTFDPVDGEPFFPQHDARRIPNGNLTIFDNRSQYSNYARAVEYELDEENFTAHRVWEFRQEYPGGSAAMGNAQRLPNGNTFIGWGGMYPTLTEAKPDGSVAFELEFGGYITPTLSRVSYRAFRYPWVGDPQWPPRLVVSQVASDSLQLNYSWNGATDVASYNVYAGETATSMNFVENVPKVSFETVTVIETPGTDCVYQIEPVNMSGVAQQRSNLILAPHCVSSSVLLPLLGR
jgi:hypothetical protein